MIMREVSQSEPIVQSSKKLVSRGGLSNLSQYLVSLTRIFVLLAPDSPMPIELNILLTVQGLWSRSELYAKVCKCD